MQKVKILMEVEVSCPSFKDAKLNKVAYNEMLSNTKLELKYLFPQTFVMNFGYDYICGIRHKEYNKASSALTKISKAKIVKVVDLK